MKIIRTITLLALTAVCLHAQTVPQLEDTQKKVQTDRTKDYDQLNTGILSTLARALVDKDGDIVVRVDPKNRTLIFGRKNATYKTTVTVTTATAARAQTVPDASGTYVLEATKALTPASTVTVTPGASTVLTLTPGQDETLNLSTTGMSAGHRFTVVITTSGTTSRTLTFSTNFKTTGTLATGTVNAKTFAISFAFDGTNAVETGRTTAM